MPSSNQSALTNAQDYLSLAGSKVWKLSRHTGKAAWIAGTSFLVLVVPLIIEMDREQQLLEFENQQIGALSGKYAMITLLSQNEQAVS